jgi:hypothetical protein
MDIAQIAQAAAVLLVPYLSKVGEVVADKAGGKAWETVEGLYETIRRKFTADQDDYAEKTLQRLEEQPTNKGRQEALADLLAEKGQSDPKFAEELSGSVRGASQDTAVIQFMTEVYGEAQVGKLINIGQAGVINID